MKESVCGQNDESRIVHADERGENKVCGVVVWELGGWGELMFGSILRSDFIAIVASRFVSVVSISDEHRFVRDHGAELLDGWKIADWPEGMFHTEVVDRFASEDTEKFRFEEVLDFVFRVGVETEDLR